MRRIGPGLALCLLTARNRSQLRSREVGHVPTAARARAGRRNFDRVPEFSQCGFFWGQHLDLSLLPRAQQPPLATPLFASPLLACCEIVPPALPAAVLAAEPRYSGLRVAPLAFVRKPADAAVSLFQYMKYKAPHQQHRRRAVRALAVPPQTPLGRLLQPPLRACSGAVTPVGFLRDSRRKKQLAHFLEDRTLREWVEREFLSCKARLCWRRWRAARPSLAVFEPCVQFLP